MFVLDARDVIPPNDALDRNKDGHILRLGPPETTILHQG